MKEGARLCLMKTGDQAPDFQLTSDRGSVISLSDKLLQASPILLVFYKYNCPTCQLTFKYLPRISKELGEENFLAIAQDTPQEAAQFRSQYKFDFEIACDVYPYEISVQYGINTVPTLLLVERDRRISMVAEGFDRQAIETISERLAKLKNVPQFKAFQPQEQVPLLRPG